MGYEKYSQPYKGVGLGMDPSNKAVITTGLSLIAGSGTSLAKIGFAQSFSLTDARGVNVIRQLDKESAGRVVETVPQIESVTGVITGVEIYNNILPARIAGMGVPDVLETTEFGAVSSSLADNYFYSLASQRTPFDLYEWYVHPQSGEKQIAFGYLDCMMTNYSRTSNLSNTTFIATINILIPYMVVAGGSNAGSGISITNIMV